jgi:hypothetical protein
MKRAVLLGLLGCGGSVIGLTTAGARAAGDFVTPVSVASQENRLSLFHDYSIDAVGLTQGSIPGSAGTGFLTGSLGHFASTNAVADRSWDISFSPIAGYDSNPEARNNAQSSAYAGADLSIAYRCDLGPGDPTVGSPNQFRLTYDATGAVYEGTVKDADVLQQTLAWSYRRNLFSDRVFLTMQVKEQFTALHGAALLNTLDAGPGVEWLIVPQASVEFNYDYTSFSFFPPVVRRRDPESDRHTINIEGHLYPTPQVRGPIPESPDVLGDILRETFTRATLGYAAIFNEPRGPDYQYEGTRVWIGMEGMHLPIKNRWLDWNAITVDAMYAHEWDNYMNPTSEGPVVLAGKPKAIRRKDHVDVFTLRGNARLFDLPHDTGTIGGFLQYDIIADRSNILVRHYNEFVVSGGVTYRY